MSEWFRLQTKQTLTFSCPTYPQYTAETAHAERELVQNRGWRNKIGFFFSWNCSRWSVYFPNRKVIRISKHNRVKSTMSGPGHPGKRPTPCRFYSSGNCVYGENCRNLHQQPSQSALQNPYQNGPLPMDNPGMLLHFEENACLVEWSVYVGLKCIERLNLCELLLHRMCGNKDWNFGSRSSLADSLIHWFSLSQSHRRHHGSFVVV